MKAFGPLSSCVHKASREGDLPIATQLTWLQSLLQLKQLAVFRGILQRPPLQQLLQAAASDEPAETLFAQWLYWLTQQPPLWSSAEWRACADPWEAWVIDALLSDDNLWTQCAERGHDPGDFVQNLAARDLRLLSIARHGLKSLALTLRAPIPAGWPAASRNHSVPCAEERAQIVRELSGASDWSALSDRLTQYFRQAGAGCFNQAYAFRWNGSLQPVLRPDPVRFEDLAGYEREREQVIANTRRLVQGLPAHNLLLYGDRGTGKSATVKALAHRFGDQGLRLVEVPKGALGDIPEILEILGSRGLSFVLFIDDLSFEANETEYKELKACLEGSLQLPPQNVRVYATSNRRHLIKEEFSDRRAGAWGTAADEVRSQDTLQEKLSLADRFGVTIIFPTPSQAQYLEIVYALAEQYGLKTDREHLARLALQWAAWQNGRSARTARQFVESLVGEPQPQQAVAE